MVGKRRNGSTLAKKQGGSVLLLCSRVRAVRARMKPRERGKDFADQPWAFFVAVCAPTLLSVSMFEFQAPPFDHGPGSLSLEGGGDWIWGRKTESGERERQLENSSMRKEKRKKDQIQATPPSPGNNSY